MKNDEEFINSIQKPYFWGRYSVRNNPREPGFPTVIMNWIATGICGFYGLIYGIGFLGGVYYLISSSLGWSDEPVSLGIIFVSLALALMYSVATSEFHRWTQAGGFLGLIANSITLLFMYTELASESVSGGIIQSQYGVILPSIAICLILFCWEHLNIEKPPIV